MANEFLSVAGDAGANVLTQTEFESLTTFLSDGFSSGIVPSDQFNKVIRQSSFMAAVLGQVVSDAGLVDAEDDGDVSGFVTDLLNALANLGGREGHTYTNSDWCYLDKGSGLILQWAHGTTSVTSGADATITLPTAFSTSNLIATVCFGSATPYSDVTTPVFVVSRTVSTIVVRDYTGDDNPVQVFSIGY